MTVDILPALPEELRMVAEATGRSADKEFDRARVRAFADGGDGPGESYLRAGAELGWFGFLAGTEHGGGSASGNGFTDAAVVAAERGARLQPGPYTGHSVVVRTLSRAGARADVLPKLTEGECWATWLGHGGGITATTSGRGLRLDGDVTAVAHAADCAWFLVTAAGPAGPVQALIPADAPGVTVRALSGVEAGADSVLPATRERLAEQHAVADLLTAADAAGAMHADFTLVVEHAKSRIAFGRPIGSFQAVKHLLADTSLWLEMSKGMVAAAAAALGDGSPDAYSLAAAAASFTGERGTEVADNCFQVFGGMGFTWEHDQHFYLRRLTAAAVEYGTPEAHRARLWDLAAAGEAEEN